MTRANTEQLKYTPWFAKAGAACSIVPISRFVNDRIFALKGGGHGCLFSLAGIDEEGMTDQELEAEMRSIEGALRGLPEGGLLVSIHLRHVGLRSTEKIALHEPGYSGIRR
jgi:type IV secretion system protein VirB4